MKKNFLPEFVYGAMDGTVTTFAIVTGSLGANLAATTVLILGFANLFADGFSMAVGSFLSRKSDIENGSKMGFKTPLKTALATFLSFIVVGFIPLSSFVFAKYNNFLAQNQFITSIVFTTAALALIGNIKGFVVKKNQFIAMMETVGLGLLAAFISYYVGYFISAIV